MTSEEFADFYLEWHPQITNYMAWKTRRYQDSDDLASEVWVDLAGRRESLRPDTANRYLWVAARRDAVARVRPTVELIPEWHGAPGPGTEQQALGNLAIEAALNQLPPRQRAVIQSVVLDGETTVAVARRMRVSPTRVAQLRDKALRRLARGR